MKKDAFARLYQLGKLHCERGDFSNAIEHLQEAYQGFIAERRLDEYLDALALLLRIHAERAEFDQIQILKEQLQDMVIKESLKLNSRIYYTLGLCASYKKQNDVAFDYLQKALNLALESDNKRDICYALNGLAIVYYKQGRINDALKEIYNLEVFFEVIDLPELKLSVKLINGHLLRSLGKFEQALEIFWQGYDLLKTTKNIAQYDYFLMALARTYYELNELNLSQMYLSLAERSIDPVNMVSLHKDLLKFKAAIQSQNDQVEYDITYNQISQAVTERNIGTVVFKNQFILLDMLRLFLQNPGRVFSKEELVDKVWKESYDPQVHDNKIYVTIKRLRKLIEPDYDTPKYIYRAKNGYYLNKSVKVLLET